MLQLIKEQLLDYNSFLCFVKQMVQGKMGIGYEISICKVIKNNSLELDSLVVLKEGKNFSPNIYLMPYYDSYLEGTELSEITERICKIYLQYPAPALGENFSYTLEEMKPFIFYRLVSYERNEILLQKVPHIRYLDLAITFHCLVQSDEEGIGTIRITNEHLAVWNLTLEDLEKLAFANTSQLFPASIKSMEEVIKGLIDEFPMKKNKDYKLDSLEPDPDRNTGHRMYILTNQKGINGAACLLYKNVISKFANQMKADLYILPSSIHEIILIPKKSDIQKEVLCRMVEDVNRTQVASEEVLSDRVYLYSRQHNSILME